MSKLLYIAFWTSAIAVMLLILCLTVPLWLGNVEGDEKIYHALFYYIECGVRECLVDDDWLDSESVPLDNRHWNVSIIVVPVLVIITSSLSITTILLLELLYCGRCRCMGTRTLLIIALLLLSCSGVTGLVALFVSFYMVSEFYKDHPVTGPDVFPWAIMFMAIAICCVWTSCVIYMVVLCKWPKYQDYFRNVRNANKRDEENFYMTSKNGVLHNNWKDKKAAKTLKDDEEPRYVQGLPFLRNRRSSKSKNKSIDKRFSKSDDDLERLYKSKRNLPLVRDRAAKKYKLTSMKYSKSDNDLDNSNYFTPKILRGSSMPEYINEEQTILRETRYRKHSEIYVNASSLYGSDTALDINPATRGIVARLSRSDPSHLATSAKTWY